MNPDETNAGDDPFYGQLADFDDALASGTPPPIGSADASKRLQRAQSCLQKLERRWPRAITPSEGPKSDRLGRFRILRELGRGGCGIVFLAFDPTMQRHVALKVPRPEVLVSPERRRHFLREAHAAAELDHPHVVPVYETGAIGPIVYIAQAYCEGPTLAAWLRQRDTPVPTRTAAFIVTALARAVQHAHNHGVLHRDLKPGNVLLSPRPPQGDASASDNELAFIPRLTDFGLAKVFEAERGPTPRSSNAAGTTPPPDEATRTGTLIGTPSYMAPEQAEGQKEIGPATDVYGLGVILYELLVGRPPFQGATDLATLRLIVSEEPPSLRQQRGELPADLEAICLKCLEKEPRRRYGSAAELAADLRRFLRGEPTRARPVGRLARAWKWARRRPAVAALVSVSLGAAAALMAATGWYLVEQGKHNRELERINTELGQVNVALQETAERERDQRQLAEQRERLLRLNFYASQFNLAGRDWQKGYIEQVVERLDELRPRRGEEDLRGFEFYYLQGRCHLLHAIWRGHPNVVNALAASRDGRTLASIDTKQNVRLWEVPTGRLKGAFQGRWPRADAMHFARDGRSLLVVSTGQEGARLWEAASSQIRAELSPKAYHPPVVLGRDGKMVLRDGSQLIYWDPAAGKQWAFRPTTGEPVLALAPDGRTVAVGNLDGSVDLRDLPTGELRLELWAHAENVTSLAFSPDGRRLASAGGDQVVRLWDLEGELTHLATLTDLSDPATSLAFSSDGRTLAYATNPGAQEAQVTFWDIGHPGRQIMLAKVERGLVEVHSLLFLPNSQLLAVACGDRTVRLLDPHAAASTTTLPGHEPKETWSLAFSPDGRTLASAGDDHHIRLWDRATGQQLRLLEGHDSLVTVVAYSPDGRTIASSSFDGTVKLWDVATGKVRLTLSGTESWLGRLARPRDDRLYSLALSPDGRLAAAGGKDRTVRVWETGSGKELAVLSGHGPNVRAVAFAPDGRTLATTDSIGVHLWEVLTWKRSGHLKDTNEVSRLAFAPDGRTLATANVRGVVRLWNWEDHRERAVLRSDLKEVYALAFSPGGKTLASAGSDRTVRLWQTATGQELLHLEGHEARINALVFAGDGHTLASADHSGEIILWRTARDSPKTPRPGPSVPTN